MKCWLVIAFVMITPSAALCSSNDTTENTSSFYEREPGDIIHLFFDDHYYLVDKDCEFRAIERIGPYDFQQQVFNGEFADFDNEGRLILEGNYVDGQKHGDFKAYHPNGQLKWQSSYIQGTPQGTHSFFYPDGKPLLEIGYTDNGARILNFWDRRGRQRVTDGNGRYEFAVIADGYNEFGYIRYIRKGRVVDGQPHGAWNIKYVFGDGKAKNAGYERYDKGAFVQGYEAYTGDAFADAPRYNLLPIDFSIRADVMITKPCTIDDHTGFTGFLAKHLSDRFKGVIDELPQPVDIEFVVAVKASGEPQGIEMKKTFDTKRYANWFREALNDVGYWLPSYLGTQYIADELTVTMEAFPDARNRSIHFYNVSIKRKKGN